MPFITAHQIHNGYHWLAEGSAIEIADDGTILSVSTQPVSNAVFYDGVLTPGFVNAHCHLELSHMKDVIPEHTGLISFLKTIPLHRNDFTAEQKRDARFAGYDEALANGIVAIGDIANTTDTLDVREQGKLHIHTFIEAIGFNEASAERSFSFAQQNLNAFATQLIGTAAMRQSITPHAPYSVSQTLFKLIGDTEPQSILSLHNQESEEESKYFIQKEGQIRDLLHTLGINDDAFTPTGLTSLQSVVHHLASHPLLLVHNTYSSDLDVQHVKQLTADAWWCLCPNANLYIENRLPDIDMLITEGVNICIGTDSLASNHRLSILSELCSIQKHFPHLSWETLIGWATINGAKALGMDGFIGSIEAGKCPGIVQITGLGGATPVINRIA